MCLLLVAFTGCISPLDGKGDGNGGGEGKGWTYPYPTLPHSIHFEAEKEDSLFFAVTFRLPEPGRFIDEIRGGNGTWNDARVQFAVTHTSSNTSGQLMIKQSGSRHYGTNCPEGRGDLSIAACPTARLEGIAGSKGYSGRRNNGEYVAFVAYYGADQAGPDMAVTISADSPIEDAQTCEGRGSRLLYTTPRSPGDLTNQTVSFRTEGPAFLDLLSAPQGGHPRRLEVRNESSLVARYEPLQDLHSAAREGFYDWNETVTGTWTSDLAMGVPAGNWTIDAIMDQKEDGVSTLLVGVLDGPCFVGSDGRLPAARDF
jgi:hypothetical protein